MLVIEYSDKLLSIQGALMFVPRSASAFVVRRSK